MLDTVSQDEDKNRQKDPNEMTSLNVAASVTARPIGQRHHAIVSYRDNHLIVGAPTLRDTVTERTQPLDLLLASLATDCTFVCQDAAQRDGITLYSMVVTAELANLKTEPQIVLRVALSGPDAAQTAPLVEAIKQGSKTYQMLNRAMTISIVTSI